ncbi:unnamed protein product [Didymodactylos carnosus]|uniref:Uncharacterized protein n=1 Tax=Didymodactylos carnosus TaxID=1234261 RepID=A0A815WJY5_9BILA|nr:unnamed protein product [Didymodactylos carnosus]CAF1544214.1 unnamed protein product [Didymodactylos carnosus]CAF3975718.1 unnamed protein product [Didymodactylos carnosus]CAF4404748.1 unnamed protein product [Didymodactylos carnosus]
MILDVSTGGYIKPTNFKPVNKNDFRYYGRYNTDAIIIPIYCLTGIVYGMVELIRRVIPKDIVGADVQKLQRMDAIVHIFYEVSGTSGAFATGLGLIPRFGNNYAFIITPIFFTASGIIWLFVSSLEFKDTNQDDKVVPDDEKPKSNYLKSVVSGFLLFGQSVYAGGKIVLINRKFVWWWSCYSIALYVHLYLENGITPQVAKRYLDNSEWSQVIVGGSNFGELLGALFVFLFANRIKTPMFWLRWNALMLLIIWYIPYYYPPSNSVKYAWIIAATFIPISFGLAAGDISLTAYIQSSLTHLESKNKNFSVLGAVMAFLYSSYIVIYAIANPLLGKYIDSIYNSTKSIRPALVNTAGVQFTVITVVIFACTFIPKGAVAFNPAVLHKEDLLSNLDSPDNSGVILDKNLESGKVAKAEAEQTV